MNSRQPASARTVQDVPDAGARTPRLPPLRILALWAVARSRSTAFLRMMMERDDVISLHEPFSQLADFGETTIDGQVLRCEADVIDAIRLLARRERVFFKDTVDFRYPGVLADHRFLGETTHALMIRHPREVIASHYALKPALRLEDVGFSRLYELWAAVRCAGHAAPVILDSDSLLDQPEETVRAYCARMQLPFRPKTLKWSAGKRPEWRKAERWHVDAGNSEGFVRSSRTYQATVDNNPLLAEYYRYHLPFYEYLYDRRLIV